MWMRCPDDRMLGAKGCAGCGVLKEEAVRRHLCDAIEVDEFYILWPSVRGCEA